MDECGCKCVAYADDLLLTVEGQSRVEVERKGTEWMNVVCEWGVNVGVCVCPRAKPTSVMPMKGSMSPNRRPRVEMNGRVCRECEISGNMDE